MSRVAFALALLLGAIAARAEVSVDREADGRVVLYFEPGPGGPWEVVREGLPEGDVLNPYGDSNGDSWPIAITNAATGQPDVVWSTGGEDREIYFSTHDGTSWSGPINLSESSGADELPSLAHDQYGNRFIAWTRSRQSRAYVEFTALRGDDGEQVSVKELSERHDDARRPALAVHADGNVYVAYEELRNGNDPVLYLAIDEVSPPRDAVGQLMDSGERPIDIARSVTFSTLGVVGQPLFPQVHAEQGSLWVDWVDQAGVRLGYAELVGGEFTDPSYVSLEEYGSVDEARDAVRDEVLGG